MNKRKQSGFLRLTKWDVAAIVACIAVLGWAAIESLRWLFSFVHISVG